MSSVPPDLSVASILEQLSRNELPLEFVRMAARGFLPFAPEELASVLSYLATGEDEEIAALARQSLTELPVQSMVTIARSENSEPGLLTRLARVTEIFPVLEALARNRVTPDATIAELAERADPVLQEVIVVNQERIIRAPEILDALLRNPALTPDVRRRVTETREEFFEKKIRRDAIGEETREDEYESVSAELAAEFEDLLKAAELMDQTGEGQATLEPPEYLDPDRISVWHRIAAMKVSERVKVALLGTKSERAILIRDRNRLVSTAAVRSPKLSESEVEVFAGLRNVEEEVLRVIGTRRDWMSKYPIMLTLLRNPKTPIGVVLPLINRLTLRDLKALGSDRGVSEVVRASARRLYVKRRHED